MVKSSIVPHIMIRNYCENNNTAIKINFLRMKKYRKFVVFLQDSSKQTSSVSCQPACLSLSGAVKRAVDMKDGPVVPEEGGTEVPEVGVLRPYCAMSVTTAPVAEEKEKSLAAQEAVSSQAF